MSEYQLRIYRIKEGTMAEFVEGWRTYIVPLRERYGFKVIAALNNEQTSEFVWIIGYDGTDGFKAADSRYYNSSERVKLPWDPTPYLENIELRLLRGVPIHTHMG
jgi:NIPSNAP